MRFVRDLLIAVLFFLVVGIMVDGRVLAQTGSVNFIGSIAGTTATANCGTPVTPSLCIVGDGVWVMQTGSKTWTLVGASVPVGNTLTINGVTKTLATNPNFNLAAASGITAQ